MTGDSGGLRRASGSREPDVLPPTQAIRGKPLLDLDVLTPWASLAPCAAAQAGQVRRDPVERRRMLPPKPASARYFFWESTYSFSAFMSGVFALVFCMSVMRNLPRSFSSSGLKVSFFGIATVWQYWQFVAGSPAFLAAASICGVAEDTPAPATSKKAAPAAAPMTSFMV